MNGTRVATATMPWRIPSLRIEGFPWIPVIIISVIALVAIFADVIAPYNPEIGVLGDRFRPPAWQAGGSQAHLLGTDHVGRDVLSRLIFGARVSMVVGFTAVIVAGIIGTGLGILSGYLGGWVDQVIMRITDTWLALPALTFAIFLAAVVGPSMWNIVIILAAVYWTRYARVIRGEVLSLRERDFVRLAIVAGCSKKTMWSSVPEAATASQTRWSACSRSSASRMTSNTPTSEGSVTSAPGSTAASCSRASRSLGLSSCSSSISTV